MSHPENDHDSGRGDFDQPLNLIIRRGDDPSHVVVRQWDGRSFVVGCRTDCDLCLDDPSVSARHLYLQKLSGRVVVFDLGSRDFHKRRGILGRSGFRLVDRLPPGQEVQVGDFWLSFTSENPASEFAGPDADPIPLLEKPIAVWDMSEPDFGASAAAKWTIQHEVTLIGRGPQCRLKLDHETVSTTHASLVFTHGELTVFDLCSRYGVRVNGRLMKSATLADGDRLAVGECQGVIRWLTPHRQAGEVLFSKFPLAVSGIDTRREISEKEFADSDVNGVIMTDEPDQPDLPLERSAPLSSESLQELAAAVDLRTLILDSAEQQEQVREEALHLMESVQSRLNSPLAQAVEPVQWDEISEENSRPLVPEKFSSTDPLEGHTDSELHAWLNERLAGLEGESPGRLSQFWKTLTGMF